MIKYRWSSYSEFIINTIEGRKSRMVKRKNDFGKPCKFEVVYWAF